VGYTPELLAGVWIGFDTPRPVMAGATGGTLAVPVWARVMRRAYLGRRPPAAWRRPSDVVTRRVSGGTVLAEDCGGGEPDLFAARHVPAGECPRYEPPPTIFVDPTPELPGRPVFPGQPRVPRPEDFVTPGEGQR
jgi:membrane carboxypeptidase/penicillin-binding protein